MADDKNERRETPDQAPGAEAIGVDTIRAMGERIMAEKWGADHAQQFYMDSPDLYEYIIGGTAESINDAFSEVKPPYHEHALAAMRKVAKRLLETAVSHALTAHLINVIIKKKETLTDFYTECNLAYPQLFEIEVAKHPDAPGYMDGGSRQQVDFFMDSIGPEDVTAVYNNTFNTVCAAILRDVAKAAELTKKTEDRGEQLPAVSYKKRPGIELTIDKLTTLFFGANAPATPKGQIPGQMSFIPVKFEKTGAPEITLYYSYDFDNDVFNRLKLEKKIDDEDYFLLSFIASYWRAGEQTVSVNKLYKDLTGDSPNTTQLTELTNRLIKIASTNIFINDRDVRKAWNAEDENKTYREILTPLAPIKVGAERFVARGQVVESGIKIYAEPDIMKMGYEIGQYTTVPKALLHVKKKGGRRLSRTPRFYRVLHFLIRRIAGIKSGNLSSKILYETFYDDVGETTTRGRQLARDCMYTILDHFKACDKWITGYKEETTASTGKAGVRIYYKSTTKNIATTKK